MTKIKYDQLSKYRQMKTRLQLGQVLPVTENQLGFFNTISFYT